MYLVDTNVLSASAPAIPAPAIPAPAIPAQAIPAQAIPAQARPAPARPEILPALADWMDRNSDVLYLSVITIAEVEDGIAKSRRTGASRKADRLAAWLEAVVHLYGSRVLPIDLDVARRLGALSDQARAAGAAPGFADLAIAATASCRNCTVLTRNVRHFRDAGIPVHDPFATLPP